MDEKNKDKKFTEIKQLCLQLKALCNEKGVEKEVVKSAELIHKLGLAYFKHSFDKVSLIKSVGLLNSAIARKQSSVFKQDLSKVCRFILRQARAQNPTIDLIQKANEIKDEIKSMRNQANRSLAFIKTLQQLENQSCKKLKLLQKNKIILIKKIQQCITDNYKNIMKDLSQCCQYAMGPSPCKFAVVGMGSLARKEITPCSDFEHVILLENNSCNENCVEYFRWLSVLFHVIVLNLQETIIPSLNIEYLNDKTSDLGDWFFDTYTSGISFDGMMVHACKFSLGRIQPTKNKPWTTELIKPVDKMLEYLSDDVNLKNGYHLSDILMKTCFVYGDKILHDAFETGIESYKISKTHLELLDQIKEQVKVDLDKFATRIKLVNLKPNGNLNIKQLFYRTSTLFITALGKICGSKSSSCFDIINELAEQRKITENTKHKLSYAVAIACEIRLCVYMKAQSQRDYISPSEKSETIFDRILEISSRESVVSYFQITYCLQREIIELRIEGSHVYSNYSLMNITICYALRLDAPMLALLKDQAMFLSDAESALKNAVEINNFFTSFDKHLEKMEKEIKICASKMTSNPEEYLLLIYFMHSAFSNANADLEDKTELAIRAVEIFQDLSFSSIDGTNINMKDIKDSSEFNEFVASLNVSIAKMLIAIDKFDEALVRMNRASEFFNKTKKEHEPAALFCFEAGMNWMALKEYRLSLNYLKVSLGLCLSVNIDQCNNINEGHIAKNHTGIGICLLKLEQYKESLAYLNISVKMAKGGTKSVFIYPESTYYCIGKCLRQLGHFEDAVPWIFQALEISEIENAEGDLILTKPSLKSVYENQRLKIWASIFNDLGSIHKTLNKFENAAIHFQKSYYTYKKLSDAKNVDDTRLELLKCYLKIYYQKELVNIKR